MQECIRDERGEGRGIRAVLYLLVIAVRSVVAIVVARDGSVMGVNQLHATSHGLAHLVGLNGGVVQLLELGKVLDHSHSVPANGGCFS